ncbi:Z1 domain-containing protein [Puerhibacterium sp. TATVAM-FAB25]|uniref:Z1 domain-containing protein n=1 Tax=Puerhibacterium sp. TATVAM-FAB25 TaxID=3093699 RepID=UPI0039796E05
MNESSTPYGTETVSLADPLVASWWSAYSNRLQVSGIGSASREVIGADARYIVENGIFGAGPAGAPAWPVSRERRGLVMGAVQSGKTASMMAVAAMALDGGVDVLIILGGTRTALWVQTLERFVDQLDTLPDSHLRRVRMPSGPPGAVEGTDLDLLYSMNTGRATRAVERRRPIVCVAMKNTAHLERLGRALHETVFPAASRTGEPFHLLVIDDEADDSSVVDASADGPDQIDLLRKQVPRRIVDLWESRQRPGQTAEPNLYATYLAYTATPQANFLQDVRNPLAPVDFVASLRTPGSSGDPRVRESSYRVPEGLKGWYTGGEIYYKSLVSAPLCVPTDAAEPDDLVPDAARAYLVASAVRVLREAERLSPAAARGRAFGSRDEAKSSVVPVMSMLVNPSAAMESHFDVANSLLAWSYGSDSEIPREADGPSGRPLGTRGIELDMDENAGRWAVWLDRYRATASEVERTFALDTPRPVPAAESWDEVRRTILTELVPGTGVSVINSDEKADDRPEFSPRKNDDGTWSAPANHSTIFVSGNVMSRGLTLEGLTTTVFTRSASTPLADTQMQMQRWFGYRGGYIELCRVLMPQDQIDLFTQYHENDEALRRDVLAAMEAGSTPDLTILQGRSFLATGKIANLRSEPLFPGHEPFIRHMNAPGNDDDNLKLVSELFSGDAHPVPDESARRGLLLDEPVNLVEAADILDRLRYADHGASPTSVEAARWISVAHHAQMPDDDPLVPFYRAPVVGASVELGVSSPYSIAAYLRLWAAAITRGVPALMTTDARPVRWNILTSAERERREPRFWLGLRFGAGDPVTEGPLSSLRWPVRPMKRRLVDATNDLDGTWGSRNRAGETIRGDEVFDYTARGIDPPLNLDGARLPGSDGMILFHVIGREDGSQTIAVGLGIPLGGPDHIRARAGTES